jgi:hypothetical protein
MPGASQLLSLGEVRDGVKTVLLRQRISLKMLLPFTRSSRGRNFYCLDVGKVNVLCVSIDFQESEVVSESFSEWIENYVLALGNRRHFSLQ